MAKRRRRARGLGSVGPDAAEAIKLARAGRCGDAIRHLYDASPHVQARPGTESYAKAEQNYRIAAIIVSKQCGGKIKRKRGRKQAYQGFYGAGGKRRR